MLIGNTVLVVITSLIFPVLLIVKGGSMCRAMMTKSWRKITCGFIPRKIHGTYIQAGGH